MSKADLGSSTSEPPRWLARSVLLLGFAVPSWFPFQVDVAHADPSSPSRHTPPPAVQGRLAPLERLSPESAHGPEDLAFGPDGALYVGIQDGRLLRLTGPGRPEEIHADVGGRPLGLDFDRQGHLLVADAKRGLLRVSPQGELVVLATEEDGQPFRFANGVAVGPSGAIYFTDASWKRGPEQMYEEMLEQQPHGRLLRYDPDSRSVARLLGGLHFANGVAVGPNESYVLVVETFAYRVTRYWLKGPRAGQSEVFIGNLPGFPDGISSNGRGLFWIALFAPRSRLLDALADWPTLRALLARLPPALRPAPERYGRVLGLDVEGRIVHDLRDPSGTYAPISSARQAGTWLYLGSLTEHGVGRVPLPSSHRMAVP